MIVNSLDGLATVDFPTAGNYDVRLADYRAFSLAWPASLQIYWNKRKGLHKKKNSTPLDCLGTPT